MVDLDQAPYCVSTLACMHDNKTESVAATMTHDISIVVIGFCTFAIVAMLLPDDFAMPIDEEGNLSKEPAQKEPTA